jgi:hypothetical protein
MYHYKIKIKAFDSRAETWIAVTANTLREAVLKAHEHCTSSRNIFYALEQTVHEITQDEYKRMMKKPSTENNKNTE